MKKKYILLILIIILASVLRIYRIDNDPPSLSWDEAAVGYNAYTIANDLRDEYGTFLPLFFKSFGDDKHPVHIYATALSVKAFGLNEFSTRLPAALFGVFNVLLLYFLAKLLFKSETIGLISALFLGISPFNLHFSHFNHEANFVLFFFMLGALFFFLSVKKEIFFLPFSIVSFFLSFISYHTAKVIVPLILLILLFLYWKKIVFNKTVFISSLILSVFLILIIYLNPALLGLARIKQTNPSLEQIKETPIYKLTGNELLGRINLTTNKYLLHFSPTFLFISGDKNARLSSQSTGEFYKIDGLFLLLGVVYLLRKRSKGGLFLLSWALIAPLPSSLVDEAPHAARASFMMGSWQIISALGFFSLISLLRNKFIKTILFLGVFVLLIFSLYKYLNYYYGEYPKRYAIDWQYGMKEIVEYAKNNPKYQQVFMTDTRSQPYIFFLYYLKTPLSEYLNTVLYNGSPENKSYNTVSNFGKFYFGGWNPIESLPQAGVLYILTPSQYDGLKYKSGFVIKKIIYYPNGTTAYYIVSLN